MHVLLPIIHPTYFQIPIIFRLMIERFTGKLGLGDSVDVSEHTFSSVICRDDAR